MLSVSLQRLVMTMLVGLLTTLSYGIVVAQPTMMDLPEAQTRALSFSPLLEATELGLKAASARHDQVGRRPNPNLEMEWENFAGSGELTGIGSSEWTLAVSQVFDLSGKRAWAKDQISQEIVLLNHEQRVALLDLQQEVGLAFAEVWFAQESVALVQEQKNLAVLLQKELKERLKAGGSSSIELTRAKLQVAAAEVSLIHAEESQRTAIQNLTSLWGSKNPDFQRVYVAPEFWQQSADSSDSITVENNPDITQWEAISSLNNARLKVAETTNNLDLELSLGMKYEKASGDRAFVIGAGIPLPSSDRNQDEVRAIGYEKQQSEQLKLETLNNLQAQLATSVANQTSARREMEIMASEIIPLAELAYEETKTAHQRGLYGLTDVLTTRNDMFDLRLEQLCSQRDFFIATVNISRLTGQNIPESDPVYMEEK